MATPESISRKEFLMKMGFSGASLMAVLASCVNKEDTYVNALTLTEAQTAPPTTTTTTTSTGTTTTTSTGTTVSTGTASNAPASFIVKVDLSASGNAALKTVGGYVIQSSIVVAQVAKGVYAAATQTCSHEPKKKVIFSNGEFFCTDHGARFDLNGKGLNSNGSRGLATYKTTLVDNVLYIS
jgi:nitrite reductase/ring-hydroxylating ferredoxin subunit